MRRETDVPGQAAAAPIPAAAGALELVDELVAVLDADRRVVFANRALLEFTGAEPAALRGLRPGEVFRCIHAGETPAGCGGTEDCGLCGGGRAIAETERTGKPASAECSIRSRRQPDGSLDFRVHAMPFAMEGARYVLVSFRDVAAEKRRAALERIFFHDVLNTASSILVYLDLLKADPQGDRSGDVLKRLRLVALALVEEIESQKTIVSAENGTLSVRRNLVGSRALAEELLQQFAAQEAARGRTLATAPFSEDFSFIADEVLLRRVLGNMLKNALEASPEGATVTLGYAKEGDRAVFRVHNPGAMGREVARQVFRRYFSTKGAGRGLGTYGMKLLTEQYLRGTVRFESTEQAGTTFSVSVPLRPPS